MQGDQLKITVEEPLEDLEGPLSYPVKDCRKRSTNQWFDVAFVKEALNLWKIYELGSTWMFLCQNESCLSSETNHVLHFRQRKKAGQSRSIVHLSGFRAIGGGHATASRVFSFLGLYSWNKNFELTLTINLNPTGKCSVFTPRPAWTFVLLHITCQTSIVIARWLGVIILLRVRCRK